MSYMYVILTIFPHIINSRLQILHDFELTPGSKRKDVLNKPLPRTPPHTPENTLMDPFGRPIMEVILNPITIIYTFRNEDP